MTYEFDFSVLLPYWEQFLRGKKAEAKQCGGGGNTGDMSDKAGSDVHEISPYVETKIRLQPYA